jgi:hypothetical protein
MSYKFSPIGNKNSFDQALIYIEEQSHLLIKEVLGYQLEINTLKVFAHYFNEYEYLEELLLSFGKKNSVLTSNTSLYVDCNLKIGQSSIVYLGIRNVDPYRMHVGCCDFEVPNFNEIKNSIMGSSEYVRLFKDNMIEIWHPDFDILGYIVPPL